MRGFFRLIGLLIAAVIVAALAIFAVENISIVPLRYIGKTFTGNLWWICVGSAVLGFILAFVLLAPGRVASGWRGRTLGRERLRLQDELAVVRAREAQLRADHEYLRADHAHISAERDQLRAAGQPGQSGQAGATTAPTAASAPARATSEDASANPSANAAPLVPPAQPIGAGTWTGAAVASDTFAQERPPTLGQRWRAALDRAHGGSPATPPADDTGYPQGPTAPTA